MGDKLVIPSYDEKIYVVRLKDGVVLDTCDVKTEVRSSLTEQAGVIFMNAHDRSIRALRIKTNGNPDEEWVYLAKEDNPVQMGRAPDC